MTCGANIETLLSIFMVTEDGRLMRRNISGGSDDAGYEFCGYIRVKVLGKAYMAHRVIFAIHHGRWPVGDIDHINGDKKDNRPSNLREVNNRQNCQNRKSHRHGRLVGATMKGERWQAQARVGRRKVYIGLYDSEEAAHSAYMKFMDRNGYQSLRKEDI